MSQILDAMFNADRSGDRICAIAIGDCVDRYAARVCSAFDAELGDDDRAVVRAVVDGVIRLCLVSMLAPAHGAVGKVIQERRRKLIQRVDRVGRHGASIRRGIDEIVLELCDRALFTMTGAT